jgi:DNA replication protein DnaC/tetratricopeptide (TPR) repeat protein
LDKYEYRLKAEQIEKLVKKKDYQTAVKISDTIDWRRVKNLNMLYIVADLYEAVERYEDCMEILNIAYDRAPVGRMLLYKMTEIATRTHNFEEAIKLYREFVKAAPHDQSRYILKYQIYRERGSSLDDQIKTLKEYKTHEYQEKWAYELASLYDQAGMQEDCVRECDELILWFSEGEYVTKAMELKMKYEPLTPVQQDKYDHRYQTGASVNVGEDDYEEREVSVNTDKFSTINLQAELAANLDEMLQKDEGDIDVPDLGLGATEELTIPEVEEIGPEPVEESVESEPVEKSIEPEELTVPDIPAIEEIIEPEPVEESMEPEELMMEELEPEELKMEELMPEELEPEPVVEEIEPEPVVEDIEPEPVVEEIEPKPEPVIEELEPEPVVEEIEPESEPVIEEPEPEPVVEDIEPEPEEPQLIKQITGRIEIDKILQEWDNKKSETAAALKAKEPEEEARKEKVRQETAELVKLISGTSDDIPEDVQQILKDLDEEQKQVNAVVTEDDLPKDIDALDDLDEAEDLTIQELSVPEDIVYAAKPDHEMVESEPKTKPANSNKEKITSETGSMNMIQELEKSLAREVADMTIKEGHLTREQAKIFAYFTAVRGVGEQLASLFKGQAGASKVNSACGNVVVTGESGNGKTTLAIDIVKALQKLQRVESSRLAKISGKKLNTRDIYETLGKLKGGALIIEKAGGLSDASMMALSLAMEGDTGGLLIILEDQKAEIQRLFHKNSNLASKFEYKVDIPVFTNDELIAFARSYARELGFSYDEFAVLALYDRIGNGQTNDHRVSVAEVKDMVDAAIEHSEKGGVRKLFAKITGKSVDEEGYRLLHEQDFEA